MASASPEGIAKLVGVYEFVHPGGAFEVHLRPDGKFFSPKFQARANWTCTETGELFIEWGKYGQYKLDIKDPNTRYFEGCAVGKPESWRKVPPASNPSALLRGSCADDNPVPMRACALSPRLRR